MTSWSTGCASYTSRRPARSARSTCIRWAARWPGSTTVRRRSRSARCRSCSTRSRVGRIRTARRRTATGRAAMIDAASDASTGTRVRQLPRRSGRGTDVVRQGHLRAARLAQEPLRPDQRVPAEPEHPAGGRLTPCRHGGGTVARTSRDGGADVRAIARTGGGCPRSRCAEQCVSARPGRSVRAHRSAVPGGVGTLRIAPRRRGPRPGDVPQRLEAPASAARRQRDRLSASRPQEHILEPVPLERAPAARSRAERRRRRGCSRDRVRDSRAHGGDRRALQPPTAMPLSPSTSSGSPTEKQLARSRTRESTITTRLHRGRQYIARALKGGPPADADQHRLAA